MAKFDLNRYSIIAACFIITHEDASAEVIYTDIPDTLIDHANETFDIDMNDDAIIDLNVVRRSFSFITTTYFSGYVTSHLSAISAGGLAPGNMIAAFTEIWGGSAAGSFTMYFPYALAEGEMIDSGLSFQNNGFEVMALRYRTDDGAYGAHAGDWYPDALDHFLGVYFKDAEGCYHYGWIRCDVKNEGKELVVRDFAYESDCDVGIIAGDEIGDTTSININDDRGLVTSVYCFNNLLYIHLKSITSGITFSLYNQNGMMMCTQKISNELSEIPLNYPDGIYFYKIAGGGHQITTGKVFITL